MSFTSRHIAELRSVVALAEADAAGALRAYHRGKLRNPDDYFLRLRLAAVAERVLREQAASVIEEGVSMPLARYSLAALVSPPPRMPVPCAALALELQS